MSDETINLTEQAAKRKKIYMYASIVGISIGLILLLSRRKKVLKRPDTVVTKYKTKTKVIVVDKTGELLNESDIDESDESSEPIEPIEPITTE